MRIGQNPAKSIETVPLPAKITVAVVTYIPFLSGYYTHSLEVLKVCLQSLWEHTPPEYDLLIFDNASCPEVREYLLKVQSEGQIQYLLLSDKNIGKGGAWNMIFQASPGEIIAYADSDVRFFPGWLARSLEILEAYPKAGMVTARPLRTPEAYYTRTLEWARLADNVILEQGSFIPWEIYREHVISLGTDEVQAREWYDSRLDWRLTHADVTAYAGAAHFQFAARKAVLQQFLPFNMDRPMGQVRSLDEQINSAGYLRLNTTEPLVRHMGNQLENLTAPSPQPGKARRLVDLPWVRKPLLKLYDRIFRIYYQ